MATQSKKASTSGEADAAGVLSNGPGTKPELKWIKITELYIDPTYQRNARSDRSRKNVAYIQGNFCWAHCGALIVCHVPEKKQYAVMDGQHRYLAAKARPDIPELPCVVISGQDAKQQAKSFVVINEKRVAMNAFAKFHASVAAGEPDAVAVQEILDECRIEVPRSPVMKGETGPRQTQAIGTLTRMLSTHSRKHIKWALTIIPEAYGDSVGALRAQMITALVEFIKANPETDRERMLRVLADVDPEQLIEDARSFKSIQGGSTTEAMVLCLERLYRAAGRSRGAV